VIEGSLHLTTFSKRDKITVPELHEKAWTRRPPKTIYHVRVLTDFELALVSSRRLKGWDTSTSKRACGSEFSQVTLNVPVALPTYCVTKAVLIDGFMAPR
jgi:hypothetical protein